MVENTFRGQPNGGESRGSGGSTHQRRSDGPRDQRRRSATQRYTDPIGDRSLPHNLEAEQSILGALLVDPQAASNVFQALSPDDFYSPRHAKLFEILQTLYDAHSTLDVVLVGDEIERQGLGESLGGLDYLGELADLVPVVANADHYAKIVREKSILRALVGTCTGIVEDVYESDRSSRDQLDSAEQVIFEIGNKESGPVFMQVADLIDDYFEKLDNKTPGSDTIASGFRDLDSMTSGFHPAEFIIIAGRPSMGKTSFAMNVVEHAAVAGKCIAIFSLEVSKEQLVQNLLCTFSQVDAQSARKRSLDSQQWKSLIGGAARLRELPIFIDDTPGTSPLSIKAKSRRLHARRPLDMIVIDYLQLMEIGDSSESRQQEISRVSRSLKALARELSVPVVALSQLSRGVENRESHRPRLSDLRESGAIEQDADVVMLLYREEYYKPEKEEAKGKAEVIVAKQRNGPTGSAHLVFRSNIMRFENLSGYTDEFYE